MSIEPAHLDSDEEFRRKIAVLKEMAATAVSEDEARRVISKIAGVARRYRVQHGIGIPSTPAEQALALDKGYMMRPHVRLLSDKVASLVRDVERGRNRMLAVSMPPRAGKSTLVSYYTPLWLLRRHPEWRIIMTSYDGGLTAGWARSIRRKVEADPMLGVALQPDGGAGARWATVEGGGMYATATNGAITGRGARVFIIDDPVKDFVDAHSLNRRNAVWNWWLSVAQTRLEPPYLVLVVMCMTGDTPVLRPDGTETPLRDIRPGDEVLSLTSEGRPVTTRVVNWANQGPDDVFAITMASGRVVRANARHPFRVVNDEGSVEWRRTWELKSGDRIRSLDACSTDAPRPRSQPEGSVVGTTSGIGGGVLSRSSLLSGASGKTLCVSLRTAPRPSAPRGSASPTTTRRTGPLVRGDQPTRPSDADTFAIGTGSTSKITGGSLRLKEAYAPSASGLLTKRTLLVAECSSLTTATTPTAYEDSSATTATCLSVEEPTSHVSKPRSDTWLVTSDEIVSVEPAGREDVFDIEVEGTHSFLASHLDSGNTRWHEDDFVGRLFSPDFEGSADDWDRVVLPAIAEQDDPLGREEGEPLLSPLVVENREQALLRWGSVRNSVGSYTFCTPAESPVLMADWTTKPISQVVVGDRVMGYRRGTADERMRYEPTVVEAMSCRTAEVHRLVLESGNEVRCTATHRWYTGRAPSEREPTRAMYAPASVGSRLLRFVPDLPSMTPQRQRDLDWIAGILDGEGHFRSNVVTIAQSPEANPEVWAKIGSVLDRLGWQYRIERGDPGNARWSERGSYRLLDTRAVIHELLERTDLAKRGRALDAQWSSPRKPCRYRDRVLSIRSEGEEPVYALQTGTGNYVVWGYASSNSAMYQQRPAPAKGAIFDASWWRFWSWDPDKATEDGRVVHLDPSSLTSARWLDSWDTSFKGTAHSDWVVGQRWARQNANRYLIAQQRGRWSFTQTIDKMLVWSKTDDPIRSPGGHLVHERRIEGAANGPAIMDALHDRISGLKSFNPRTSKEARARAVTPEVESGNVYLPHPSDPGNEWVADLLSELRAFPHDTHDDQVDALTQALLIFRDSGKGLVTVPGRENAVPRTAVRSVTAAARSYSPKRYG